MKGDQGTTSTAGNDTFKATVATMGALDVIDGGEGTDTLNIRDTAAVTKLVGTYTGIEKFVVNSDASVGVVAADATIAAKQQFTYDFTSAVFGGTAGTSTLTLTVGGVVKTVLLGANNPATATAVGSAIEAILDDAFGAATYVVDDTAGKLTITAATAGKALPAVTLAAGTATITTAPVKTTVQANQVAADAVSASTFSVAAGATSVDITAGTTANVSSVSTADTVVNAGGAVVLTGGLTQTVTTYDSVRVSGGTGAVAVTVAGYNPATSIAAVSYTGWSAAAAGVFVRGGTTVSVTEVGAELNLLRNAVSTTNSTAVQIGANPASASGTAGANSGAFVSNPQTGAEVIGNLSSAPTGNVSVSAKTNYTDTGAYKNVAYGTGAATIYMNGGTTASVTGAGTVTVKDINTTLTKASTTADALPGTSKLTTVNLTGVSGATGITSDAITTISAVDTSSTVTVNSNVGANTGNIALNVANSAVTLVDAAATSVSVGASAGSGVQKVATTLVAENQASTVTLTAAKATSLSFSGANDITLAASTLSALKAITSTATGALTLGTLTDYAKLTSADLSGGTGTVKANIGATITGAATDRAFAYTGSAGTDIVVLTGAMKSGTSAAGAAIANTVDLGAGNDMLLSNGGSIAAGSTISGGAGTDTIAISLVTAGNQALISGFEQIGLDLTTGTKDTDLVAGATGLVLLAQGATYTNVEQAQSLNVVQNVGAAATTLSFTAADVAGSSDSYAVNFAAKGSIDPTAPTSVDAGTLEIAGIENVKIASNATSGYVNNTIDLTAANLKTVTVTGSALVTTLGFVGTNGTNSATAGVGGAVSSIDASALGGKLVLDTTGVTVNNAADFAGLSVKSGVGADVITLAQFAIVDSGAGKDVINVASAGAVVTTGDGKDLVNVASALNNSGAVSTTIKDVAAGDAIDFAGGTTNSATAVTGLLAKLTLTTEATLADAITSAVNQTVTGNTGTQAEVTWFQYGGNTYVIYDAADDGATNGGLQSGDIIVKLTGAIDLTNAVFDSANATLTFA